MIQRKRFTPQEDVLILERVDYANSKGFNTRRELKKLDRDLHRKTNSCYGRWRYLVKEEQEVNAVQTHPDVNGSAVDFKINASAESLPEILGSFQKAGIDVKLSVSVNIV